MKHRSFNTSRNRKMMEAFKAGVTAHQLAVDNNLSEKRVRALLADEQNRMLTSPDPFYRAIRQRRAST